MNMVSVPHHDGRGRGTGHAGRGLAGLGSGATLGRSFCLFVFLIPIEAK